jgi:hypothetical protein
LSVSKFYDSKLIKSGSVYELYEYEKSIKLGDTNNRLGRKKQATEEDKKRHRRNTLANAKKTVISLINANVDAWGQKPKFVTLTFADNIQDIKTANYEFKKFKQRLEYMVKVKLKYVCVIEFQKRGAIHYHVVFFNLPYIKSNIIADIWAQGFIKINAIDDVDNVGAYVSKYMTKNDDDIEKTQPLEGQKSYFTSRGLKKPEEIILNKKKKQQLKNDLSNYKKYDTVFENEYMGLIHYIQYNTKRKQ